ncbi:MAG: TetR/AcrR family transcriptional regulator [Chloroflexota bacterium]|nr:MAG: TetR/AcrR family transcriptional regulator [Chloroflexota bacterium]
MAQYKDNDTPRKKEMLRDAAVRVFRQKGYAFATIRDIAAEAGIQKGSVYYYVTSKEDILADILQYDMHILIARLEQICGSELPAEEKLRQALTAHLTRMMERQDAAILVNRELHMLSPEKREVVVALRDRYEGLLGSIIDEGVRTGDFDEVDVRLTKLAIVGMYNAVAYWFSPSGPCSPEQIAESFTNLIFYGLLQPQGDSCPKRVRRLGHELRQHVTALQSTLQTFHATQLEILSDVHRALSDTDSTLSSTRRLP